MSPNKAPKQNAALESALEDFERKKTEFLDEMAQEHKKVKEAIDELKREKEAYIKFSKAEESDREDVVAGIGEREIRLKALESKLEKHSQHLEEKINQLAREQNEYMTMALEKERTITTYLEEIKEREKRLKKLEDSMKSKVGEIDQMLQTNQN